MESRVYRVSLTALSLASQLPAAKSSPGPDLNLRHLWQRKHHQNHLSHHWNRTRVFSGVGPLP